MLKNKNVSITGGITTNGYLLNDDVFDKLLKYGITSFQVTIDGNPDCHNKTRKLLNGTGTYSTIFKNLYNISAKKEDFSVIVRCNIDETTNIDIFLQDYYNCFGKDSRFSLLLFPVANWSNSNECSNLISREELLKNLLSG